MKVLIEIDTTNKLRPEELEALSDVARRRFAGDENAAASLALREGLRLIRQEMAPAPVPAVRAA
jgi:hypothetical protein